MHLAPPSLPCRYKMGVQLLGAQQLHSACEVFLKGLSSSDPHDNLLSRGFNTGVRMIKCDGGHLFRPARLE